jgi:hypothetical protein
VSLIATTDYCTLQGVDAKYPPPTLHPPLRHRIHLTDRSHTMGMISYLLQDDLKNVGRFPGPKLTPQPSQPSPQSPSPVGSKHQRDMVQQPPPRLVSELVILDRSGKELFHSSTPKPRSPSKLSGARLPSILRRSLAFEREEMSNQTVSRKRHGSTSAATTAYTFLSRHLRRNPITPTLGAASSSSVRWYNESLPTRWSSKSRYQQPASRVMMIIIFICVYVPAAVISRSRYRIINLDKEVANVENMLSLAGDSITQSLQAAVRSTNMLGTIINLDSSNPNLLGVNETSNSENFKYLANEIIKNFGEAPSNLMLAPTGILTNTARDTVLLDQNFPMGYDTINPLCLNESRTSCQLDRRDLSLAAIASRDVQIDFDCPELPYPCLSALNPVFTEYGLDPIVLEEPDPDLIYLHDDFIAPRQFDGPVDPRTNNPSCFWGFTAMMATMENLLDLSSVSDLDDMNLCYFSGTYRDLEHVGEDWGDGGLGHTGHVTSEKVFYASQCMNETYGISSVGLLISDNPAKHKGAFHSINVDFAPNSSVQWTLHAIPKNGWVDLKVFDLTIGILFVVLFLALWYVTFSFRRASEKIEELWLEKDET